MVVVVVVVGADPKTTLSLFFFLFLFLFLFARAPKQKMSHIRTFIVFRFSPTRPVRFGTQQKFFDFQLSHKKSKNLSHLLELFVILYVFVHFVVVVVVLKV